MTSASNQVGWYCGLQGPFKTRAQALAIRKPAATVGYKLKQADTISYRVDPILWTPPNKLLEKQALIGKNFL
jgi:hypothetical protein